MNVGQHIKSSMQKSYLEKSYKAIQIISKYFLKSIILIPYTLYINVANIFI